MGKGKQQIKKNKIQQNKEKDIMPFFWIFGILAATIVAYLPAFKNGLTNFDDIVYVSENPYIRQISWQNIVTIFTEFYYGGYYPLTLFSFMIDIRLGGMNPAIFHFTNIFLHLANTLLVFIFIRQLFDKIEIAVIAALLFGLHTLHVESVAWVSERKDVLYSLFFFASLITYNLYLSTGKQKYFVWALYLFLMSVLSKTMAVALVPTLVLLDWFKGRKLTDKKVILEKTPFLVIGVLFGILTILSQKSIGAIAEETTLPMLQRFVFACYGFSMYILKSIIPFGLSAFYPYPIAVGDTIPVQYWLSLIPVIATLGLIIYSLKKKRDYAFALLFFVLNIVLVLQIIQINDFVMADRFMYVASLGLLLIFGFFYRDALLQNKRRLNLLRAVVGVYAIFLLVQTNQRCEVWKDSISVWDDVIEKYPDVYKAWNQRGMAKADELGDFTAALKDYDKAIHLNPDFATTYINRGFALTQKGNTKGALEDYNKAIKLLPDYAMAYNNRGITKANSGDIDGAIIDFTKAIELDEKNVSAFTNRGLARASKQDWEGAMADYNTSIEIEPGYYSAYNYRALLYSRDRKIKEALADFDKCLELMPDHAEALYNRGVIRLQMNQRKSACEDLRKAAGLGFERAYGMVDQYCQ